MSVVYDLDHDHGLTPAEVTALVGGKAANLAIMATQLQLPVPPAFVLSTEACREVLASGWPDGLDAEIRQHLNRVEQAVGRRFGDPDNPLLVSVRSGAPVSMPGMMDTILNLGLNEETAAGLATATGDPGFAQDCLTRLRAMFADLVGCELPSDPWEQLRSAIAAVFGSWASDRAQAYRRVEDIDDALCTAVTVQAMVFGNRGPDSATGVLFTRNPSTGERTRFGDVMFNAQGEDVVAGTHRTEPIGVLEERQPEVASKLWRYAATLEHHFADLCDIEFTVEQAKLWLLQVRIGKRSPQAALRMAVDMAEDPDFPLSREQAVSRVAAHLVQPPTLRLGRPEDLEPIASGLAASPGLATGEIATSSEAADAVAAAGRPVILVRPETSPQDVPSMAKAVGVLTSLGGLASHSAVVARGWGIPAVVGATDLQVTDDGMIVAGVTYKVGDTITIDGSSGEVFLGAVGGEDTVVPQAATLLGWASQQGIEIAPAAAVHDREAEIGESVASSVSADDVIACLAIKGSCAMESLAEALITTPAPLAPIVDELIEADLAKLAAGSVRLTDGGAERAEALWGADRARWGLDKAGAAIDDFVPLDRRMKATVTAWQLREVDGESIVNDHTDDRYDAAVLDDLRLLHGDARAWLNSLGSAVPRFVRYEARLERAAAQVTDDQRFVASPRVDSYHSVWFELHEDLIHLAGRNRADETAEGRA